MVGVAGGSLRGFMGDSIGIIVCAGERNVEGWRGNGRNGGRGGGGVIGVYCGVRVSLPVLCFCFLVGLFLSPYGV